MADMTRVLHEARLAFERGRLGEAERGLTAVVAELDATEVGLEDPARAAAVLFTARLCIERGDATGGLRVLAGLVAAARAGGWKVDPQAVVLRARGELERGALGRTLAVLRRAEEEGVFAEAPVVAADALSLRGVVAKRRGELGRARALLEGAAESARRAGDVFGAGRSWLVLAELYLEVGEYDEVMCAARLALGCAEELDSPVMAGGAALLWGRAAYRLGMDEEGARHIEESRAANAEADNDMGRVQTHLALFDIAFERQDLETATTHLDAVEALAVRMSPYRALHPALKRVSLHAARGDYDVASARLHVLSGRLRDHGSPRLIAISEGLQRLCASAAADWSRFDEHHQRWRRLSPNVVHGGEAWAASRAAVHAEEHGALARAMQCRADSLDQRLRARDHAGAAQERVSLRKLREAGGPVPTGELLLEEVVGAGGMGQVWRGRVGAAGVPVAVKIIVGERACRPGFLRAFEGEVRAAASLVHPHIVRVLDHGRLSEAAAASEPRQQLVANAPLLVMELVTGGTLREWCGVLPWAAVRTVLLDLLDALAFAHAHGLAHLDLKPSNVLVRELRDGVPQIALTDFGLARAFGEDGAVVAGTPGYMTPEQLRADGRAFGPWTDIFALGCVAVALVDGATPIFARSGERRELGPLTGAPVGFRDWVERCLAPQPQRRFQRAADAACALRALDGLEEPATGEVVVSVRQFPGVTETFMVIDLPTLVPGTAEPREVTTGSTSLTVAEPASSTLHMIESEPTMAALPVRLPLPPDWRTDRPPVTPAPALGLFGLRPAPIVARAAAQDALWAELLAVASGEGARMVALTGDKGSGRSRLLEWLSVRAHELGVVHALQGGASSEGLRVAAARLLHANELDLAEVRAQVERRLAAATGHAVKSSLRVSVARGLVASASPAEIFHALRLLLRQASSSRAVLLVLDEEDGDTSDLGLVKRLLAEVMECPVLAVVVTSCAPPDMRTVHLGPLSRAALGDFADQVLPLSPSLRRSLVADACGSPSRLFWALADHVAQGRLTHTTSGLDLLAGTVTPLLDDVGGLSLARLEPVPEGKLGGPLRALQLAAVMGQQIDGERWAEACRRAAVAVPEDWLSQLYARRVLVPDEGETNSWRFSAPGLVQALRSLAARSGILAALHGTVADVLETAEGTALQARRAEHLAGAGRFEEAAVLALAVADHRRAGGETDEAAALLGTWRACLDALGTPPDAPDWADGDIVMAELHTLSGRHEEGERLARQVIDRADRSGLVQTGARARRVLAVAVIPRGDLAEAISALEASQAMVREGGWLLDEARTNAMLARAWGQAGRLADAAALLRETVDKLDQLPERDGETRRVLGASLTRLALVVRDQGDEVAALTLHRRAAGLHRLERRYQWLAADLNGIGESLRRLGDLEGAEAAYREAWAIGSVQGLGQAVIHRVNIALVLLAQHRWVEARHELECAERQMLVSGADVAAHIVCVGLLATSAASADPGRWRYRLHRARQELTVEELEDPDVMICLRLAREAAAGRPGRLRGLASLVGES